MNESKKGKDTSLNEFLEIWSTGNVKKMTEEEKRAYEEKVEKDKETE